MAVTLFTVSLVILAAVGIICVLDRLATSHQR